LREVMNAAKLKAAVEAKKKAKAAPAPSSAGPPPEPIDPEALAKAHIAEAKVVPKPARRSARQQAAFQRLQTLSPE